MEVSTLKRLVSLPEEFLSIIPQEVGRNLLFRRVLLKEIEADVGYRTEFLKICRLMPQIAFKTLLWTFDPRKPAVLRNLPFITRPRQDRAIGVIKDSIDTGRDLLIDKSRDEGATWLVLGVFYLYDLLQPESMFLVGSRKEELVDKPGDHKCLFAKLSYLDKWMPDFLRPRREKTHLHMGNIDNGSAIDGEATNDNFGAGDRRLAVMVDEYGRIEPAIASNIQNSLHDTSDCIIYNSTHFFGAAHPYNKLLTSGKVSVFILPWEDNPVKNPGMYRSPDLDVIEIKDIEYYRSTFPGCFEGIEASKPFKLSKLEVELASQGKFPKISFKADGGLSNNGGWRSPWYDKEDNRRDRRSMAQNIDRCALGSGDLFFDSIVLKRIHSDTVKPPVNEGELLFDYDEVGRIQNIKYGENHGKRRLKTWQELGYDSAFSGLRFDQKCNYIVSCDISAGSGSSNSIIGIYNVNTCEKVGIFACPYTPPESLADMAVAICHWVGGATKKAFLIWEANGPGNSFGRRVGFHGYSFFYIRKDETNIFRPEGEKWGWFATGGPSGTRYDMLTELRIAMAEGLKTNPNHKAVIIHDTESLEEYYKYVYLSNGDVGIEVTNEDISSGARTAHGDRVIADGLFIVALSDQPKAAVKEIQKIEYGSLAWRIQNRKPMGDLGRFIF